VADYLVGVFSRTLWQLWQVFGVAFVIAYLLQCVGSWIRGNGACRFGDFYWYIVSPGVACHETGHAMGCFMTGTKLHKFVPFCRKGNTLGYITHEARGGLWGGYANVIIAAGPIWFGCIMIMLLTWLLAGGVSVARWGNYFNVDAVPGSFEYCAVLLFATLDCYREVFATVSLLSIRFCLWLYLTYCIASEIGLSSVDLEHMWRGLMYTVLLVFLVNLIPVAGKTVSMGVFVIMPYLFKLHVLMVVALGVNIVLYLLARFLFRVIR